MVGDVGSHTAGRPSSFMDLIYKICRSITAALTVALHTHFVLSTFKQFRQQSIESCNGSGCRLVVMHIHIKMMIPQSLMSHSLLCQIGSSHSRLSNMRIKSALFDSEGEMKCLFFDTETTGLLENILMPEDRQPHVIELFMLLVEEDGTEIDSFSGLFRPPVRLTEEITKITGILKEDLRDAPPFRSRLVEMQAFINRADVLLAHNLMFDLQIMDLEFGRAGAVAPWKQHDFELICTAEATEHLRGFRLSLTMLHEHLFGEPFSGAHRAEADVRSMAKCWFELAKRGLV